MWNYCKQDNQEITRWARWEMALCFVTWRLNYHARETTEYLPQTLTRNVAPDYLVERAR